MKSYSVHFGALQINGCHFTHCRIFLSELSVEESRNIIIISIKFMKNNKITLFEPWHGISNNVVCATSKPQISLRIRAVWSEPLLVAWIFYECYATDWTSFWVSKPKRRLHRLVWAYTCQNATLLEITCYGSFHARNYTRKNAFHAIVASMKTCVICKCMYVSEVLPVFVVSLERQTENFLRSAEENNNKHK